MLSLEAPYEPDKVEELSFLIESEDFESASPSGAVILAYISDRESEVGCFVHSVVVLGM